MAAGQRHQPAINAVALAEIAERFGGGATDGSGNGEHAGQIGVLTVSANDGAGVERRPFLGVSAEQSVDRVSSVARVGRKIAADIDESAEGVWVHDGEIDRACRA